MPYEKQNIFNCVKAQVTARAAAEKYGLKVKRSGMCRCPFHDDHEPSMKVDTRFHCFGCGADGDVIDLTARLFGLEPYEAAVKLADDFCLNPKPKRPQKGRGSPDGKNGKGLPFDEKLQMLLKSFQKKLLDCHSTLLRWKEVYAPRKGEKNGILALRWRSVN